MFASTAKSNKIFILFGNFLRGSAYNENICNKMYAIEI